MRHIHAYQMGLLSWALGVHGGLTATCHAGADVTTRTIALTGDQAPGTDPGVTFVQFSSPYNDAFPVPAISPTGRASFFAFLDGTGVDQFNNNGLWLETANGLELLARAGDPAPGVPGATYASFPNIVVPSAPLMQEGRLMFVAGLTGASTGIALFQDSGDGVELLLLDGAVVPDTGLTMFMNSIGGYNSVGDLMLSAGLGGAGVTVDNNETVWTLSDGVFDLIAREGDHAPGTEVGVVHGYGELGSPPATFSSLRLNDDGDVVFQSNLLGPGMDYHHDEAVYLRRDGALELLLRESDPAPGAGEGVTFGGNSVSLSFSQMSFNNLGQLAFSIRLGGAIPTTTVLYSTHTGALAPLVMPFDDAPGTREQFILASTPVLNDAGHVAFRSALTPGGQFPPFGVWWDRGDGIEPVIVPGDPAPGLPEGSTITSISAIAGFNAQGQLALWGALDHAEIGWQSALILVDSDGSSHIVAARSDAFEPGVGEEGTVVIDSVFAGPLNDQGEFTFRLDFTDDSSGNFVASIEDVVVGDVNGDGTVGTTDLLQLLAAWGACPGCAEDLDGNGAVGVSDLLMMLANWG